MNKQKTALWFLTSSLIQIDKAIYYFQEYRNTGNKEYWDKLIVPWQFSFCLVQIWDRSLMSKSEMSYILTLIYKHDELDSLFDKNNIQEERIFNLFYFFRKEILKIFLDEFENKGWGNKIKNEQDIFFIKEATGYSKEKDGYPEFVSSFLRIVNTRGQSRFLQEDYL